MSVKTVHLTLFAASLLCLPPSVASPAAGIYQTQYRYSFDGIARAGAARLAFVICEDSCAAAPSPMRAPKALTLSVRVSQDQTGEKSLPGTTVPTGITVRPEIPKNQIDREKLKFPPQSQG